jgi:hypothetical protein
MLPIKDLLNPIQTGSENTANRIVHNPPAVRGFGPRSQGLSRPRPLAGAGCARHHFISSANTQVPVNYPPFENVDEATRLKIAEFNIPEFGIITHSREHIPYNSAKKDFFAKTGRESIEGLGDLVSAVSVADALK